MQLAIENVSKRYGGGNWALRNFTLQLGPGVLGLLGPNGAGKTTLMSVLATITRATEGRVVWNGTDLATNPDALRSTLGYLPQDFGVYPNLNAVEFLEYLAAVKGLDAAASKKRIDELLDLVNLTDVRKRPLGGYSGGMKQRVGIAQALLNDPQLLIVDEPTAGLDPEERVRFRNLLSELSGQRIVILFYPHRFRRRSHGYRHCPDLSGHTRRARFPGRTPAQSGGQSLGMGFAECGTQRGPATLPDQQHGSPQ